MGRTLLTQRSCRAAYLRRQFLRGLGRHSVEILLSRSSVQSAKWTQEQVYPMSCTTECVLCAGGPGEGQGRVKSQGLPCTQKTQPREHWNKQSPEGGEFSLSSFLFSETGPVPKPLLNLVRIWPSAQEGATRSLKGSQVFKEVMSFVGQEEKLGVVAHICNLSY